MQVTRFARGQTIIEFVVAMPIVLLALFAVIYFSQYGVVSERAELALRYGGLVEFNDTASVYSAADIYNNMNGNYMNCPAPSLGVLSDGGPFPGPTSAPFWQPASDANVPAPSSSCQSAPQGFGGSQFIASHFWGETQLSVNAGVDVPPYLQPALGGATAGQTNTTLGFIHAAYPSVIMYCSTEVRNRVDAAITASGNAPLPTPIPDGTQPATPPPDNGHCD
jgi:hypothetical protein